MSENVTQSDVSSRAALVSALGRQHRDLNSRVWQLSKEAWRLTLARNFFDASCFISLLADRFQVWRGGVIIVIPSVLGAATFIACDMATSHRSLSIMLGIILTCTVLLILAGLLLYPEMTCVKEQRASIDSRLPKLIDELQYLKQRQIDLKRSSKDAEAQLKAVQEKLDYIKLIRSREHKLQQLFACNWRAMRSVEFEAFLGDVFTCLGYRVEYTKRTGDQGVDLVVTKQSIRIAIQVKGYHNSVSNSAIQEAYTGMAHYRCHACAVITNSRFTSSAVKLSQSTRCFLISEHNFRDFVLGKIDLLAEVS